MTGVVGRYLGLRARRGAPGAAADDADRAAGRAADHRGRRRRLAALLPRLRPAGTRPAAAAAAGGRAGSAQLLLVQRADGGLTIGDTHEYDEPFAFDVDKDAYDHLRARAEALLGVASRGSSVAGPGSTARSAPAPRSTTDPRSSPACPGHRAGRTRHDLFPGYRRGDVLMTRITVACLDMAGTTVRDDGTVIEAFTRPSPSRPAVARRTTRP